MAELLEFQTERLRLRQWRDSDLEPFAHWGMVMRQKLLAVPWISGACHGENLHDVQWRV